MRRVFWLALGATVGVLVVRRAGRLAEQWTPDGLAGRVGDRLSEFWTEVQEGMAAREDELRLALGLDGPSADADVAAGPPARAGAG